ncbi:MAG: bifunctional demethylmenaquinone methyltransferase/2-methoxy-6-polyprenyl-1,4-benzoquinol methylase UbiE [Alphaproteobacteria bacterium]|nr:bifunctional demethylmenaquinone methyltransferase/2-methoxy-6-polyprenyl-1,4-benzoquinol methylase UbiE [Alphaproteobacteria bacterium]
MQTHFGFQTVDEQEKERRVRGVFDSVAGKYDIMNDVMSAGLHRLWKREMVSALAPRSGQHVLDVAGGTGDIAFRILKYCHSGTGRNLRSSTSESPDMDPGLRRDDGINVTVCDINEAMLNEGKNRAIDANRREGLEWVVGNAEALPFPDAHFDAYTIAFGIRNVTHIEKALAEAYRVLKIGGKFLCLEFSHIPNEVLAKIYDSYSFNIIPWIGQQITQDRASYQYLVESIRKFPDQETFAKMIKVAGFGNVNYRNMTGGVVALHTGRKL